MSRISRDLFLMSVYDKEAGIGTMIKTGWNAVKPMLNKAWGTIKGASGKVKTFGQNQVGKVKNWAEQGIATETGKAKTWLTNKGIQDGKVYLYNGPAGGLHSFTADTAANRMGKAIWGAKQGAKGLAAVGGVGTTIYGGSKLFGGNKSSQTGTPQQGPTPGVTQPNDVQASYYGLPWINPYGVKLAAAYQLANETNEQAAERRGREELRRRRKTARMLNKLTDEDKRKLMKGQSYEVFSKIDPDSYHL